MDVVRQETRPGPGGGARRIVVGVDGSASSDRALRWAVRYAALTGEEVEAVIAWQYPISTGGFGWAPVTMLDAEDLREAAEKTVTEAISSLGDPGADVRTTPRVIQGTAAQVLISAAAGADLLVVGSRGHGGFAGALLGSVSVHCAHHAPCPVVVVRDTAS